VEGSKKVVRACCYKSK